MDGELAGDYDVPALHANQISGKYVGNRPVKLKKADTTAIRPVEIGHRKAKQLEQELKKNRHKPY
jgi:hypothetical protein